MNRSLTTIRGIDMKVSKEMADLFYDQCVGSTDGHMAAIPNSPVLWSIAVANNAHGTKEQFADFLYGIADRLSDEKERVF